MATLPKNYICVKCQAKGAHWVQNCPENNNNIILSTGSIQRLINGATTLTPATLQVLDVKQIVTQQSGERCRLVLSDGQDHIQAILAPQCVNNNTDKLTKYCIINLKKFVYQNISEKKICVVMQYQVLQKCNQRIQCQSAPQQQNDDNNETEAKQAESKEAQYIERLENEVVFLTDKVEFFRNMMRERNETQKEYCASLQETLKSAKEYTERLENEVVFLTDKVEFFRNMMREHKKAQSNQKK